MPTREDVQIMVDNYYNDQEQRGQRLFDINQRNSERLEELREARPGYSDRLTDAIQNAVDSYPVGKDGIKISEEEVLSDLEELGANLKSDNDIQQAAEAMKYVHSGVISKEDAASLFNKGIDTEQRDSLLNLISAVSEARDEGLPDFNISIQNYASLKYFDRDIDSFAMAVREGRDPAVEATMDALSNYREDNVFDVYQFNILNMVADDGADYEQFMLCADPNLNPDQMDVIRECIQDEKLTNEDIKKIANPEFSDDVMIALKSAFHFESIGDNALHMAEKGQLSTEIDNLRYNYEINVCKRLVNRLESDVKSFEELDDEGKLSKDDSIKLKDIKSQITKLENGIKKISSKIDNPEYKSFAHKVRGLIEEANKSKGSDKDAPAKTETVDMAM